MPAIHLRNISFQYSSAVAIVTDASCSLGTGWTGVVGANGIGKTTLLRLIDGTLVPSAGSLEIDPADGLVVRCPQTAHDIDSSIRDLADSWDGEAQSLRGRLELDRSDLARWTTLSPGERKRWQIGGALFGRPDVLLLDEPTNHLDAGARDLLLAALDRFRGVGIVVSHDRSVLNTLCRRILRIDNAQIGLWTGSYDTARQAWEADEAERLDGYRSAVAERRKVERRLADKRRTTATKEARHKRQLRQAGVKDKDARSMEKKGRFSGGQKQASHEMSLLRDQAQRLRETAQGFEIRRRLGGELFFDYQPARRSRLMSFQGRLDVAGVTLADDVDVVIGREDRILLTGPNGAGKSTLLSAMLADSTLDKSRVLYLPQELTAEETRDLIAEVNALDPEIRGRVLGTVAVLGSEPQRLLATEVPSPGEARKLLIALGLGRGAWILLLDEPTNHLDLPSIERLESALCAYPGAVVVVTHDEDFARETTTTIWTLDNGELTVA
jgi:ATPase subunit of ABC transporter with duplicated ATPase domains